MADMADTMADTVRTTRHIPRRQYDSGSLYQRTSDWRWFGSLKGGYTRSGGRKRITVSAPGCVGGCKKTCPHIAEIKRRLAKKEKALDRGDIPTSERTTVKAWSETWLERSALTVRPNTHTADRAGVGWIIEAIGHKRLDQLTPADIHAVHAAIEASRSSSTARRYHGTLTRMLTAASKEGLPVPSHVFLVDPPEKATSDRDAIPTPQVLSLLQASTTVPQASRWLAAMLEGLRQAEALGLTWDEVNEDGITLAWQLQALPYRIPRDRSSGFRVPRGYEARQLSGQMHLVRPKSKAGWRWIPMLPVMWKALESWRLDRPPSPHGLVWPAADGRPANAASDLNEWHGIQGTAMVGHPNGRYYTGHEIRHTTGTLLKLLNVPEDVRVAIMGHSSIASTRAYEHTDDQLKQQMRDALQGVAGVLELG